MRHSRVTLTCRPLEERALPSSVPTFAVFRDDPRLADTLPFQTRTSDFRFVNQKALLSIDVQGTPTASPLVVNKGSKTLTPLVSRHDADGLFVVASVSAGKYQLDLPNGDATDRQVNVALTGDVNGDFRVTKVDLALIQERYNTASGAMGYLYAADADRNGTINAADYTLAKRNLGVTTTLRRLALVGGLAPDSDANGNGIVLRPNVEVAGQSGAKVTVSADLDADGTIEKTLKTDAQGRYRTTLTLPTGQHDLRLTAKDGFGQVATCVKTVALGDVVLDWNAVHLTAIHDYTTLSNNPYPNRIVNVPPPLAVRNLAIVHGAMYDAINAVEAFGQPYHTNLTAPAGTSASVAAATAAHRLLYALYPKAEQRVLFDAAQHEALTAVPDGAGKTAGITLGEQIAADYLAWRSTDGARTVVAYTPGTAPGDYALTEPDFLPVSLPQWPQLTPFAVPDITTFRPPPPPDLSSEEYATALQEVQDLGRFDSATRTADQTEIALFWADGPGTATPPGHWNRIAQEIALADGQTLAANARTFAMLNVAVADAGIASWDAKYNYDLWRPITAIRRAATDGNAATTPDASWVPLLKTPPFPTYTSGHSTFSGAAATVLTHLFGARPFTSTSDTLDGFAQKPLGSILTRQFANFEAAAEEASHSRIYGGIHFAFDCTAGLDVGHAIGNYVTTNLFGLV